MSFQARRVYAGLGKKGDPSFNYVWVKSFVEGIGHGVRFRRPRAVEQVRVCCLFGFLVSCR